VVGARRLRPDCFGGPHLIGPFALRTAGVWPLSVIPRESAVLLADDEGSAFLFSGSFPFSGYNAAQEALPAKA
jgi:hypothetical protein